MGHYILCSGLNTYINLTILGKGTVDGQGYVWWWYVIANYLPFRQNPDIRSHMFRIWESSNILIEGIRMVNSPLYHISLEDVDTVEVRDFEIYVDVHRQKSLLKELGYFNNITGKRVLPILLILLIH